MVSLINRNDYLNVCQSDPHLNALADFIQGEKVEFECQDHPNNANDMAICALKAISRNNKEDFIKAFSAINQRSPKKDSDWVFNDLLVFCCLLGVKKFEVDDSWIRSVLQIRKRNSNKETQQINDTFWAILNDNFEDKNHFPVLLINFKRHLNKPFSDEAYLNNIYLDLITTPFPTYKSNLLNILTLGALDTIVINKGLANFKESQSLKQFQLAFKKRIRQFSNSIWWIMLILSVALTAFLIFRFAIAPSQKADLIGRLVDSLPYIGFGGLVPILYSQREKIVTFIEKLLLHFFSYSLD